MQKEEIKKAALKLFTLGYDRLHIEFAGSGDSGSIDEVFPLQEGEDSNDIGYDEKSERAKLVPDKDEIESFVHENCLDSIGDWWNNEGGQGHVVIWLETGKFETHVGLNRTVTDDSTYEGNFYEED